MSIPINVTEKEAGIVIIAPVGSIDADTYAQFGAETDKVLASSPKGIIFDMKDVDYIASLGMSVIYKTKRVIEKNGGIIAVVNLQPQIKKVFDIVKFFPSQIFTTVQQAHEHLNAFFAQKAES